MISGIFGLPRAGKTTALTWISRVALKGKTPFVGHLVGGRTYLGEFAPYDKVFSTFPLPGCYKLEWETLGHFDYHNCLLLIDEISLYCDNRDWKNFTPELRAFFCLHGHRKLDIIYCGQHWEQCDKKIQQMTQQLLLIEKFGGMTKISPINTSFKVAQGAPQMKYYAAAPLGCSYIRRKKYYQYFDSFAISPLPPVPLIPW